MFTLIFLLFNLPMLHDLGFRGEGIRVAIIDAGFYRANDPRVFPQERIAGFYDLIADDRARGEQVTDTIDMFSDPGNYHGTACLSTMLYCDSTFTGTAPDASFYLIRSEDIYSEYYGEVTRLARAFLLADSLNVDVISVSLGYNQFDDSISSFVYADMTGISEAAQAAQLCARHGRLVCAAAGNDGKKAWHYLSTPGDADSILTVGAVRADSLAAAFSSYGPSADARIKPEVSAWGYQTRIFNPAASNSEGLLTTGNGTSFATPEIAGMVACLRQALPDLSAMQLRDAIIASAHLYPEADDQRGFGIPDAWQVYQNASSTSIVQDAFNGQHAQVFLLPSGRIAIIKNGAVFDLTGRKLH